MTFITPIWIAPAIIGASLIAVGLLDGSVIDIVIGSLILYGNLYLSQIRNWGAA